jgi:folate-binding protein YgfZ
MHDDLLGPQLARAVAARAEAPYRLITVRGRDAVDFAHRLCTQDIEGMAVGTSRPAAFLTGKGKLVATCRVGRTAEGLWIETQAAQAGVLAENLERFHFTEQLAIAQPALACSELVGRDAPPSIGRAADACEALAGGGVLLTGERRGVSWVRCFTPADSPAPPPWAGKSAAALTEELAECWRILAGLAAVGIDTEATTLGLEADLDDHVSTTKGCYTGQEIVARIHTYGHVNRKLTTLVIGGDAPIAVGTPLCDPEDGGPVGRVMSSAVLPGGGRRIALGYLPRDFLTAGTHLRVGDGGGRVAQVAGLGPATATAK